MALQLRIAGSQHRLPCQRALWRQAPIRDKQPCCFGESGQMSYLARAGRIQDRFLRPRIDADNGPAIARLAIKSYGWGRPIRDAPIRDAVMPIARNRGSRDTAPDVPASPAGCLSPGVFFSPMWRTLIPFCSHLPNLCSQLFDLAYQFSISHFQNVG